MKIISVLEDIKNIDNLKLCDEIIIPSIYSISYKNCFDKDEIIKIVNDNKDMKFILGIDGIIDEKIIDDVIKFIDELEYLDLDLLFSDMAILYHYQKKNKLNKLIYDASTYLCNKSDIEYYQRLNIRVFVSNELSIDDLKINCRYDNVILQAYGYYPIYYSKRKVLSLYKDYAKIDYDLNKEYEIKEELREEKYKIKEYDSHSVIYNAYKILIFEELNELKPAFIYINTNDIEIIKCFKKGNEEGFEKDLEDKIKSIDERVDKSLMYIRPSILNKDEKN